MFYNLVSKATWELLLHGKTIPIIFLFYMNDIDRYLGCTFMLRYIEHCARRIVICSQTAIVCLSLSIFNVSKTFKNHTSK